MLALHPNWNLRLQHACNELCETTAPTSCALCCRQPRRRCSSSCRWSHFCTC
jgi:hypothetical protein